MAAFDLPPYGLNAELGVPGIQELPFQGVYRLSDDGLSLYFCDYLGPRPGGIGGTDLWVATRASVSDPWGTPTNLGPPVNTTYDEIGMSIWAVGCVLLVSSNRPGGLGDWDIWLTTRPAQDAEWREPVDLGLPLNSASAEGETSISGDGSTIYFWSYRSGGSGRSVIWQVSTTPVVDLNGDWIVDSADLCIMVDNWHTDNTLCDIAPLH